MTAGALRREYGFRLFRARVTYTNRSGKAVDLACDGKGFLLLDNEDHRHRPLEDTRDLAGNEKVCKQPVAPGATSSVVLAYRISSVLKLHGLEVFNSADERDPDGERTRLRFVNQKR